MVKKQSPLQSIKPTMMDGAALAGVSQATVSLVLNGSQGAKLSKSTKQRVQEAAANLGYKLVRRGRPHPQVKKSLIVFIADELVTDPWMAIAFDGVREKALEFGLSANLFVTRGDPENEKMVLNLINQLPVLGIVYGTILTRCVVPPAYLFEHNTMLLNCFDSNRSLPSVKPGDTLGGRIAAEHLIKAGRKRIGLINGQQGLDATKDRLKGYRQALDRNDIAFDPELVRPGNWEPSSGYDMTLELMKLDSPPDAIFCANDMMALGCFDALRELGLRVPHDISVIGFDNREVSQFTHPPLSTLVLPHYEMGATAAEFLIDKAGGLDAGPAQMKVACTLIERESVKISSD